MGLKSIKNGLVPTRFLCMMAHMVILISVLINREANIKPCDPVLYKDQNLLNTQFIVGLSISIGLLIFEFLTFMLGITLFNSFQSFLSTFLHSAAAITLSSMVFFQTCSIQYWYVFSICSCIPFVFELLFLIGVWFFKITIN